MTALEVLSEFSFWSIWLNYNSIFAAFELLALMLFSRLYVIVYSSHCVFG